jgi:hypothetical protein
MEIVRDQDFIKLGDFQITFVQTLLYRFFREHIVRMLLTGISLLLSGKYQFTVRENGCAGVMIVIKINSRRSEEIIERLFPII